MKKYSLVLFSIFLFSITITPAFSAESPKSAPQALEYNTLTNWTLAEKPIDIVHSLDGKYVFFLTEKNNVLVYDSQGNRQGVIPVAKGVTAIDISPRAEFLYLMDNTKSDFSVMSISFIQKIDIAGSPVLGPEDAPVTIILFTDFECPYCKKLEPLLAQVLKKNSKNVKLVFKNMPLSFHKFADKSARAALAAGNQGKFWEFHDNLFSQPKLSDPVIEDIAKQLELDMEKWRADMRSKEVKQKIARDLQQAQQAGVTGTPTIFINGRTLQNRSLEGFQTIIDEELAKK